MGKREEFTLPSSDGVSKLHCVWWKTEEKPKAVLQIFHGMIDHVLRYHEFASVLADQGIAVIGHDHLGHGMTSKKEDLGYFADTEGAKHVLKDMRRVNSRIKGIYPDVPCFVLGHSMGSFFLREYLTKFGTDVDGAIIMGTGNPPAAFVTLGRIMAYGGRMLKGARYQSRMMNHMMLGHYNNMFRPVSTGYDWLTRDIDKAKEYEADPYCSFVFTCEAYEEFFKVILDVTKKRRMQEIPKELPVFIVSGDCDPVGGFGKQVEQFYEQLQKAGMKDVSLKLYREGRHEILNEIDRAIVYEDIAAWICSHIKL